MDEVQKFALLTSLPDLSKSLYTGLGVSTTEERSHDGPRGTSLWLSRKTPTPELGAELTRGKLLPLPPGRLACDECHPELIKEPKHSCPFARSYRETAAKVSTELGPTKASENMSHHYISHGNLTF